MKSTDLQRLCGAIASMLVILVLGLASNSPALAQQSDQATVALKERVILPKPTNTVIDPKDSQPDVIVLKFHEGTKIRLRNGFQAMNLDMLSDREAMQLARVKLDVRLVLLNVEAVNNLTVNKEGLYIDRLFTRPEAAVEEDRQAGERNAEEELADLNLYYNLYLDETHVGEAETLIDRLNALDIVEIAYPQPIYSSAQAGGPTASFVNRQGYLEVANSATAANSNGIDARYAWTLNGGRADGIRIVDVEYDWQDRHEDLPAVFYSSGLRGARSSRAADQLADRNHGTAVLGVLRANENTIGTTGIVPNSAIGFSSAMRRKCFLFICWNTYDVADAINRALPQLANGDLILLEQQVGGPTGGLNCNMNCGNCPQFGLVPVENNQAEFDAIRNATANGRIVVEAAGNGQMNLGDARYNRRFDRAFRDSGAIIVGAGNSTTRAPMCWSNAGDRVDVQGWGNNVVTLGYGDLWMGPAGERQSYTMSFSGTSSASPVVTGAAAAVQGVRRFRGLRPLHSFQMRALLRTTGVAQATGRQIGPLPNLRNAIALYVDPAFLPGLIPFLGLSVGTPAQPYTTLPAAVADAWDGAQIKMAPANYSIPGGITISRPTTLQATGGTATIIGAP